MNGRVPRLLLPVAVAAGIGVSTGCDKSASPASRSEVRQTAAAVGVVGCETLPNPVYFPATSDIRPALSLVASVLAVADSADRMTVVYRSLSSCNAMDYALNETELTGTGTYWTGATNGEGNPIEASCTIPAGTTADLVASDVTVQTCTGGATPADIFQSRSFVQVFGFVVPPNSTQTAITAGEAYFVMNYGGEAGKQVPPWTNPDFVMIRTPAASTQLVIGMHIGVPGTLWSSNLTNINNGSGDIVSKVIAENTTGNAEATLGILSTQRYDQERDTLKWLAFQPFGSCLGAVYADSTSTSFDKQNVRDGHYPIWAHLEWVARLDSAGNFVSPEGEALFEIFEGIRTVPGLNAMAAVTQGGGVPECAMRVTRDFDGSPIRPFTPAEPCHCFFEYTATGATSCTPCVDDTPCGSGSCNFGYCEGGS